MIISAYFQIYALPLVTVAAGNLAAADLAPAGATPPESKKPVWLTEVTFGAKEGYDDNVWMVAGKGPGLKPQGSWITTLSPKLGFNFAPLLGQSKTLQTLSLIYAPDFAFFHEAPAENHNTHRLGNAIKGTTGDFSCSLDNAFLFNDGSKEAPIYAASQTGGPANQLDRFRSNLATGAPRERREQIQDRSAVVFQYDLDPFFIRPTASLLYYDLMTDWHNAAVAPYKGYQNYVDRADVNGGADFGCKVTAGLAVTVGYRYGHQYQQALPHSIDLLTVNGQQAQSTSDYQRILLGLEGKPWHWLEVKLAGGPDFRDYNSAAPVDNYHPVTYYGEALITATLTAHQSLTVTYKQWQWVSSTGRVPFFDSSYALVYHWNATQKLGLDLGGKFLNSDYNCGSSTKSLTASLRNDAQTTVSTGASYAFTPHFSASLAYAYDFGRNLQNLPAALAPTADYRQYNHQLVSAAVQYKF